jgi:signal transduction histidine kinase
VTVIAFKWLALERETAAGRSASAAADDVSALRDDLGAALAAAGQTVAVETGKGQLPPFRPPVSPTRLANDWLVFGGPIRTKEATDATANTPPGETERATELLRQARTMAAAGQVGRADAHARQMASCCPDARDQFGVSLPLYAAWLRAGLVVRSSESASRFDQIAAELQVLVNEGHLGSAEDLVTLGLIADRVGPARLAGVIKDVAAARRRSEDRAARTELASRWIASADRPATANRLALRSLGTEGSRELTARVALADGTDLVATIDTGHLAVWIEDWARTHSRFEMTLQSAGGATRTTAGTPANAGVFQVPLVTDSDVATIELRHRGGNLAADSGRESLFIAAIVATILLALALGYLAVRDVTREMRLSAMRASFVAGVTHELKTPLASIRLIAETLRQKRARPESHDELLDTVVDETDRLGRLVDNVLSSSRIESGTRRYAFELVPLGRVVRDALARLNPVLQRDGFRVHATIEDPDLAVMADPDALGQSVINLVGNAAKYSGTSREIRISVGRHESTAKITVEDEGVGIEKSEQARVFDAFYRASNVSEHTTGAGLGLSLVRHFAMAHGGRVSVVSTPGKGSAFTLHLPIPPTVI